jgi:hypothetical protein
MAMKTTRLPKSASKSDDLNPLVFTDFVDTDENPRRGLGYHQLYDPTAFIGLLASLPDIPRTGDIVTLYWGINEVQRYEITDAMTEKGYLSFLVSTVWAQPPGDIVFYTLYDPFNDLTSKSPERFIDVDRKPPGGLDPDTDTAINERLAECAVHPSNIQDENEIVIVTVPRWIDAALGDELTVMWNNARINFPKLDQQAYARLIAEGKVDVLVPPDVLQAAGSSPNLLVNYEIRDFVDNYSLVSLPTFVDVDIEPGALLAPLVREADPGTLVLDLAHLGNSDGHVDIPFFLGDGKSPYTVKLIWIGKTANATIELKLDDQTVQNPGFEHAVFEIPNARLKEIAGGSAVLHYTLIQTGDPIEKKSRKSTITLTGVPVPLLAPAVQEASGTVIDIGLLTGPILHVIIPLYIGKKAGDTISLIWSGLPSTGGPANYVDDVIVQLQEEQLPHVFEVNREHIDPLPGGTLKVNYQVLRVAATSPENSEVSQYNVIGASSITEDFTGQSPQLIKAGGAINTTKLHINFLSGEGFAGFPERDVPPTDPGPLAVPFLHICYQNPDINPGTQTIEIAFLKACKKIDCDIYGSNAATTITLLDANGAGIYNGSPPGQPHYHFSHTAAGPIIQKMRIVAVRDWTYWDNFVMTQ